jgi:hypothetical protein
MPFSQSEQISAIVGYAQELQPMSVLDVGTGMGVYGFLLRTNLEHINLFDINGADARLRDRSGWQRRIDGIEGFPAYVTPVHEYAYNDLFLTDAFSALARIESDTYDLVLAIDILEHFEKEDGKRFLAECRRVSRTACLVSTPKEFIPQEIEANPLEDHRSHWSLAELQDCGFTGVIADTLSWIVTASTALPRSSTPAPAPRGSPPQPKS